MTINEIVSTFPDSIHILQRIIREDTEILKEKEKIKTQLERKLVNKATIDDIKIIAELIISCWQKDFIPQNEHPRQDYWQGSMFRGETCEERIDRCSRILNAYKRKSEYSGDFKQRVEKAKDYPIGNLIKLNKFGTAKCPLHQEKTASFKTKNNKWRCFGCDKFGDVIDLYQLINGVSFKEAVEKLQ